MNSHLKLTARVLAVIVSLLGGVELAYSQKQGLQIPRQKKVDPCKIASADQLKSLISAGIGRYFPLKHNKDGEWITISDPQIVSATCPNLKVVIDANFKYDKTRGFPQFQSSGTIRISSKVVVTVSYVPSKDGAITAANVTKALACLNDIEVVHLSIENVPDWVSNRTWIKQWLNEKLPNQACFDVTDLVKAYLEHGGSL